VDDRDIVAALDRIHAGSTAADEETGWLDFKQPPGVSGRRTASEARGELERLLLDACLCFANGEGGVVVLGVADRVVGPAAFVGTDADVDKVKARVYELSSQPLLVDVRERSYSGTRLLELRVPRAVEVHADMKGRAPVVSARTVIRCLRSKSLSCAKSEPALTRPHR
jgi:ATP-dependent DNA helicase RecG